MFRKIIIGLGTALLCAIFAAYFVFASYLEKEGRKKVVCKNISVSIIDSALNRFVSREEVKNLIVSSEHNPMGRNLYDVNLHYFEELLETRSAIKHSEVSFDREGCLSVAVTQRRPVLRMETKNGGFYADESGYVFPLVSTFTSFVPIVTGDIPVDFDKNRRGIPTGKNKVVTDRIVRLANFISGHEFWNAQIEQIDIQSNGDAIFYMRIGDQTIYFGPIDNIDYKFAKLMAYYRDIVPVYGWEKYSEVNLKFSNQIICTKREQSKKII